MWSDLLLKALRAGTLELLCPSIVLRQEGTDSPAEFVGPGVIEQKDGRFRLRQFVTSGDPAAFWMQCLRATQAGRVVPDDHFLTLDATDTAGRRWQTRRIYPDLVGGPRGTVLEAQIHQLESGGEPFKVEDATCASMFVSGVRRLPFRTPTRTVATSEGRDLRTQVTSNRERLTLDDLELVLARDEDDLAVFVHARSGRLPPFVHERVLEALQLVTATPLSWHMLCLTPGPNERLVLRPTWTDVSPRRLQPPLNPDVGPPHSGDIWALFAKYFTHCLADRAHRCHPMSYELGRVAEDSAASSETFALSLSVAIESVLVLQFAHLGSPSEEFRKSARSLLTHLENWAGDSTLKKRARGSLGQLCSTRADDRLRVLQDQGVISAAMRSTWKVVRNQAAHPDRARAVAPQEWAEQIGQLTVLLYHLVAHAIGYAGALSDYSTRDWPIRRPGEFPTGP